MKSKYPPLHIWLLTAVAGSAIFLNFAFPTFTGVGDIVADRQYYIKKRCDLLIEKQRTNPSACTVLVIGSSMTRSAVAHADFFQKRFKELGKDVNVFKIHSSGNSYKYWEDDEMLSKIKELQPDLILFEDHAFFHYGLNEPFKGFRKSVKFSISKIYRGLFGSKKMLHNSYPSFEFYHADQKKIMTTKELKQGMKTDKGKRFIRNFEWSEKLNLLVQEFDAEKTKTIVYRTPNVDGFEQKILSPDYIQKRDDLLDQYRQKYHVEFWEYGKPISIQYYRDKGHLNKKGNTIYSQWLFDQIRKENLSCNH